MKLFQKLSLFSLSQTQIENIVRTNSTNFKKQIDRNEIIKNPYLLCETYRGPEKTSAYGGPDPRSGGAGGDTPGAQCASIPGVSV